MQKGRLQSNGDLAFPKRGKPPPVQQGYYRSPSDPYLFKPIIESCIYRGEETYKKKNCGCEGKRVTCDVHGKISLSKCIDCKDRKES